MPDQGNIGNAQTCGKHKDERKGQQHISFGGIGHQTEYFRHAEFFGIPEQLDSQENMSEQQKHDEYRKAHVENGVVRIRVVLQLFEKRGNQQYQ